MTEWLERLRSLIQQRTTRERWMAVLALGIVAFLAVQSLWLQPLQARSAQVAQEKSCAASFFMFFGKRDRGRESLVVRGDPGVDGH